MYRNFVAAVPAAGFWLLGKGRNRFLGGDPRVALA